MAMIMSELSAPRPRISSAKPGKLVAIKRASSTATGFSLASPMTRNAMAMRWSRWVATVPPPGAPAFAAHDQVVAVDFAVDAVALQARGDRRQPVGFLHPQFVKAAHPRLALGEARRHREDRIFVDHRRRALGRHVDALQRAARTRRSATSSPPSSRAIQHFDVARPSRAAS